MHEQFDNVDRALASLRSPQRTTNDHKNALEEKLMQEFHTHKQPSGFRRHRALIVSLAVMLVGGVGFAATDAGKTVKRIFVTLQLVDGDGAKTVDAVLEKVGDNGDPIMMNLGADGSLLIETLDGEGVDEQLTQLTLSSEKPNGKPIRATIIVEEGQSGSIIVGDETTPDENFMTISVLAANDDVTIEAQEADASDDATQVTINLNEVADGDTKQLCGQALLRSLNVEGLRERLGNSEMLDNWVTTDGRTRELFVLPVGGLDIGHTGFAQELSGVQVVVVTDGNDGQQVVQLLGSASGLAPADAKPTDVSWGEDDTVALTFTKPDGGEMTMDFQTSDEALDDANAVRLVLADDAEPKSVRFHKPIRDRE